MTLDPNMGYYTIDILTKRFDLTAIIIEFGKIRYNIFPMGMCTSSDMFQAKIDNLLGGIKGGARCVSTI